MVSYSCRRWFMFLDLREETVCLLGCTWAALTLPWWYGRQRYTYGRWWWWIRQEHWRRSCQPCSDYYWDVWLAPVTIKDRWGRIIIYQRKKRSPFIFKRAEKDCIMCLADDNIFVFLRSHTPSCFWYSELKQCAARSSLFLSRFAVVLSKGSF